jgi:hypothetical protein
MHWCPNHNSPLWQAEKVSNIKKLDHHINNNKKIFQFILIFCYFFISSISRISFSHYLLTILCYAQARISLRAGEAAARGPARGGARI